jgi:hypothetical protein
MALHPHRGQNADELRESIEIIATSKLSRHGLGQKLK